MESKGDIRSKGKVSAGVKLLLLMISISLLSLLVLSPASAEDYPSPTAAFYVNDFANVLDPGTERYISENGAALEKLTSAQVVVVTIDSLDSRALEEYSLGLFREWGIGDKEKNNGVLILLDVGGRHSRIDVGYGLEGALPDGKTGRIQDAFMVPYFKEGEYNLGIQKGFDAIVNEVYYEYGYEDRLIGDGVLTETAEVPVELGIPPGLIKAGIIILLLLVLLDYRFTRCMITLAILRMLLRGLSSGGRYGRGGGGGSGGRFGGGGSAGGGGSSRGW